MYVPCLLLQVLLHQTHQISETEVPHHNLADLGWLVSALQQPTMYYNNSLCFQSISAFRHTCSALFGENNPYYKSKIHTDFKKKTEYYQIWISEFQSNMLSLGYF